MDGNNYTQKQLDHIKSLDDKQIQASVNTLRRVMKRKSLDPNAKKEIRIYSESLKAEQKSRLDQNTNAITKEQQL